VTGPLILCNKCGSKLLGQFGSDRFLCKQCNEYFPRETPGLIFLKKVYKKGIGWVQVKTKRCSCGNEITSVGDKCEICKCLDED